MSSSHTDISMLAAVAAMLAPKGAFMSFRVGLVQSQDLQNGRVRVTFPGSESAALVVAADPGGEVAERQELPHT
jgi:hypothetical protein